MTGCTPSEPAASEPTAAPTTGAEAAPAGKRAAPPDLTGEWVEFWAVRGDANAGTQRFVFTQDGHFEWHAAIAEPKPPVVARFGTFTQGGMFVDLKVSMEERSDGQCDHGCRTKLEPAVMEQIALAECPPNDEAQALDSSYRCLSFGEQTFWHR